MLENRRIWMTLIDSHPNKSVTILRGSNNALYSWLYRNDKEWLLVHSPRIKRIAAPSKVNWYKRDKQVLDEVKRAISRLRECEKPVFINKSQVGKNIGKLGLIEKHLDKLPQTREYLNKNLETREAFQLRRVEWACQKLMMANEDIMEWKIVRLAGLKYLTEEFKQTIENYALLQQESLNVRK